MEKLIQFYEQKCDPHTKEDFVFLRTDFEKIEIKVNDVNLRCLELNNLVRFLNPKVNLSKHSKPHISVEDFGLDDLDEAFEMLNEMETSEINVRDSIEEMIPLYFLPWHIEEKIKAITCGNHRKKIDYRIKSILPQSFIDELELTFRPEKGEEIVEYDDRPGRGISFFKFFRGSQFEECVDFQEIERKINEVKYKLKVKFVESMDFYFIGNINVEVGLLERDKDETNKDPLYYHFNLWKLRNMDLSTIYNEFSLFPFNEEVM
ncbi:hypothetical protein [Lysinibacillus sp. NPDC096212]|uniref:hypothetical protein n=1 Tax=Lysinibacillus sp. NPDC096212 TaxID=3364135 RepID=UPI003825A4E9